MSARDRAIKRVGIENAIVKAHAMGVNEERERIIELLRNLKVIRDSMLGDNWKVIYTEQGAMDITLDRLDENE